MSTTNTHPGLTFGGITGVNGLRRSFQTPHSNTPNKPSPVLPQHASPYSTQAYTPQQPPQQAYPHHLFSNPAPSPVANVSSVQNGPRQPQPQVAPSVPGPRQRPTPSRQLPPQPNPPLTYLPPSLSQQTLNHQPLSQQSLGQQSLNQPSLSQQSLNQQSLNQQPLSQSVSQSEPSILSQSPAQHPHPHTNLHTNPHPQHPHPHPHQHQVQHQVPHQHAQPQPATLPPQPPAQPQVQQVPQVQQQQAPAPSQRDSSPPVQENHHDDQMDVESPGDSGEGEDSSLEPKLGLDGQPFVPRQPMGTMMSPPPEGGSYPTLEAVHKAVLAYCTSVGYAIVIGRSKKTVPGLKKVLFVCDRAGKPPRRVSPEMRKRKTSSRKCDCQFGFFAIEQRTQWTVRYRPDSAHLEHNHGPSESPLLHPAARKLDSKMVAAVKALKESGVGVSQTLEILQNDNPHVPLLPRDIYNARAAINRNPQKVNAALAENRPAIYSKPHPSAEERIRADLRRELAKAKEDFDKIKEENKKKIEELEEKLREKDKMIEKFEMFIDICNQRVMVQRERLESDNGNGGAGNSNP